MIKAVISAIKGACAGKNERVDKTTPLASLSIASFSFVSALLKLEEEYSIEFGFDDLDYKRYATVDDVIKKTESKISGK